MERILNEEERIRRAEERYYSKRNINVESEEKPKISLGLLKKMFLQLVLCFFIYVSIFFIQTKQFSFSSYVLKKAQDILNYDIDISEIKNNVIGALNTNIISKIKKNENTDENEQASTEQEQSEISSNQDENALQTIPEANDGTITQVPEEASSISQMEEDAKYIKENISMIKPLEGTITSRFGIRNPSTASVPTYHTGIDIAANLRNSFCCCKFRNSRTSIITRRLSEIM